MCNIVEEIERKNWSHENSHPDRLIVKVLIPSDFLFLDQTYACMASVDSGFQPFQIQGPNISTSFELWTTILYVL